ncbi:hypothetical protein AB1Y20_018910 [Prymnesium parvum]|uniref:Sugar phosphate transporter domain-containing protein n=1 Tax=Prymnesium parvum TaxID=97485 RepID=A0AB34JPZ7_PRYPA
MRACWLSVCIPMWYAASAVCVANSKLVLREARPLHCPLSLTALQFSFSALLGALCLLLMRRKLPPRIMLFELCCVSGAYTFGFVLLNASLGKLTASFSETVRSLEPLTSFTLAWLAGGRGVSLSPMSGAALLAVVLGGAISVAAQPAFDVLGLLLGFAANFMFSSRTLLDKVHRLTRLGEGGHGLVEIQIDPVGLFTAQHVIGLFLMVPITLSTESTECTSTALPANFQPALLSSAGFFAYNFLSLICLLMLNAVTHSIANSLRRAVTIISAALLFHTSISGMSMCGIVLIVGGSIMYALAKTTSQEANSAAADSSEADSQDGLVEPSCTMNSSIPAAEEAELTLAQVSSHK